MMERKKNKICVCRVCGRQFLASTKRATLCSPECSREADKKYKLDYYTKHPRSSNSEAARKRELNKYIRYRLSVLDELCIKRPCLDGIEFNSEVQVDNFFRSWILK